MEGQECYHYGFIITNIILLLVIAFLVIYNHNKSKKCSERVLSDKIQQSKNLDKIRKEHSETLERVRLEMLRREEDGNRHWVESEKETMRILNGVSNLIDLSENINKVETDKMIGLLNKIYVKLTTDEQG